MRTTFFDKDPYANDIDKYDDPRYAPIEDDFVEQDKIESAIDHHRAEAVAQFFRDFDLLHSDSDPDPIVLACREIEIGITKAEWDEHRAQKAAEDAEAIGAF